MSVVDPKFTKPVSTFSYVTSEDKNVKVLSGTSVKWTLCDRSNTSDKKGNYFTSFNLPQESAFLSSATTLALSYPELYQLNVDQIVFAKIPFSSYTEYIDGKSFIIRIPVSGSTSTSALSAITIHSSLYSKDVSQKSESSIMLGDNVCFLFSDQVNKPYSGNSFSNIGSIRYGRVNNTWAPPGSYDFRPFAVSYSDVTNQGIASANLNTDARTVINYAVQPPSNYPDGVSGYNYDIPVGFAILDKGYVVITHPNIVNNVAWQYGYTGTTQLSSASTLTHKTDVYWTGATSGVSANYISFNEVDTKFKLVASCSVLYNEFYISNNCTYNRPPLGSRMTVPQDVVITEVGLYNAFGELVAVSKFSEPVSKSFDDILLFEFEINL